MIRDFVTVPITQSDFPDFHIPSEHLVEMSTLAMCLSDWVYRRGEAEWRQLLDDVTHVVVKISTYNYRSAGVLSDDFSNDLRYSCCPVLQVLLFSWFEIAVENLNVLVAELQLSPTEECPECLHKLESKIISRSIPASINLSPHSLVRLEPIEEELGL
jgi:hypothetical protein